LHSRTPTTPTYTVSTHELKPYSFVAPADFLAIGKMLSFVNLLMLGAMAAAMPTKRTAPSPELITFGSATFSGNGCPQGTVSTSVNPDKTVITFGFDAFQAYIGPGTSYMDRTKNCQLHLNVKYPKGYNFAVLSSTYHGFALLEGGVNADFFSTYYYSEKAADTFTTRTTISGGGVWADGQVYTKEDVAPQPIVRAPCGDSAILNINNRISLRSSNSQASGMITNDDATVDLSQQLVIDWYEC